MYIPIITYPDREAECHFQLARLILGEKWLDRKVREAKEPIKNPQKMGYLYKPSLHPAVEWMITINNTESNFGKAPPDAYVYLAELGRTLAAVQNLRNFDRLLARLKSVSDFQSALFEAEVAHHYISEGREVEFLQEQKGKRSPDLLVKRGKEQLYVECKCRELMSNAEMKQKAFWLKIEQSIFDYMRKNNLNYYVVVRTLSELTLASTDLISNIVCLHMKNGGIGQYDSSTGYMQFINISDPQIELCVVSNGDYNQEFVTTGIQFKNAKDLDHFSTGVDVYQTQFGFMLYKNLRAIGYIANTHEDRITGIEANLRDANGQFSDNECGIVWIRLPDFCWQLTQQQTLLKAKDILERELRGNQRRRVNTAIACLRSLDALGVGVRYSQHLCVVKHQNPFIQSSF